ncbi:glutamate transporter permease GluD [Corynebacterium diphtheriae]|nr:glutamate transporter permease GluD [Corynebacterium diphtheriae]
MTPLVQQRCDATVCTRPSPSALKSAAASIVLALLIGYIEVVRQGIQSSSTNRDYLASLIAERIERQLRAERARKNIVAKVPEQPDQGLDTKDNVVVDWHDPALVEIKNPAQ